MTEYNPLDISRWRGMQFTLENNTVYQIDLEGVVHSTDENISRQSVINPREDCQKPIFFGGISPSMAKEDRQKRLQITHEIIIRNLYRLSATNPKEILNNLIIDEKLPGLVEKLEFPKEGHHLAIGIVHQLRPYVACRTSPIKQIERYIQI